MQPDDPWVRAQTISLDIEKDMAEFEAARRSQEANEHQDIMVLEAVDSNQSELNSGANRLSNRTTVKS